jgi:hypothetical protein
VNLSKRKEDVNMDKDTKKLLDAAIAQGFKVRITKKGHAFISKDGQPVTTFGGTPSDKRSNANSLAAMKRAGFRWPVT